MIDDIRIDVKDFSLNQDLYRGMLISYITKLESSICDLMSIEYFPDHIRRFNEAASYLCMDINKFEESFKDIKHLKEVGTTSFAEKISVNKCFRKSARDVCVGIEFYTEKMKALCRFYFYMDEEKTKNGEEWLKTIKQFEKSNNGKYITRFLEVSKEYNSLKEYSLIKDMRNDETHNESIIELLEYKQKVDTSTPGDFDTDYLISDELIFRSIKNLIESLKTVVNALDDLLMNLSLGDVYNYIEKNKDILSNIISPDERLRVSEQKIKHYKSIVKELEKNQEKGKQ